ncbi:MAG: DUF2808 domain-containing protein [Cyanobacteria bacterium J06627_15]
MRRFYKVILQLTIAAVASAGITGQFKYPTAHAVEFSDGSTAFVTPPQFVEASSTSAEPGQRNSTQFFTIDLAETADEPLYRVDIIPQNLVSYIRPYRLQETQAFEGSRFNRGDELPLGEVTEEADTKTVSVIFDPPVEPGRRITVALRPQHTPRLSGIYIFRIVTFPPGERPRSHIAGHARINIDDRDDFDIFR